MTLEETCRHEILHHRQDLRAFYCDIELTFHGLFHVLSKHVGVLVLDLNVSTFAPADGDSGHIEA